MARYHVGDKVKVIEGIEGSRLSGAECEVFQVDEGRSFYMIGFRDPAVLGGLDTRIFFWIREENLEEVPEDGRDEPDE